MGVREGLPTHGSRCGLNYVAPFGAVDPQSCRKHRRCASWLFLFFVLPLPLTAQSGSAPLAELRRELDRVRAEAPQHQETRGASPRLTVVKHQLRDWIETHLGQVPSDPNGARGADLALAERLNAELKREHLFREASEAEGMEGWSAIGFLAPVCLKYNQRQAYLILQTAIEVYCGSDESAYLYCWQGGVWKRIWQTEQNTYTKDQYAPQLIRAVLVSPSSVASLPYVLTLGTEPWCASNWHDVYVRLWRVGPTGEEAKLLLDRAEWAYLGRHDIPIQGSVGSDDALIEYRVGSIDAGIHSREAVLHYSLANGRLERIDPVALSPRDFVEEWLAEPWEQSRTHSEPSALAALQKAHLDTGRDEFQPTRSCRAPDLWQVGLESMDGKMAPAYYLVRWRPPYHFTMVQVSRQPSADCTSIDPTADDEDRTLFPVQDWREW